MSTGTGCEDHRAEVESNAAGHGTRQGRFAPGDRGLTRRPHQSGSPGAFRNWTLAKYSLRSEAQDRRVYRKGEANMTPEQMVPPPAEMRHPGFADTAEAVEEGIREMVGSASAAITGGMTEAGEGAQNSVESVMGVFTTLNRWVRRNPWAVWAGCALAGLLLVRLFVGPRDRGR